MLLKVLIKDLRWLLFEMSPKKRKEAKSQPTIFGEMLYLKMCCIHQVLQVQNVVQILFSK